MGIISSLYPIFFITVAIKIVSNKSATWFAQKKKKTTHYSGIQAHYNGVILINFLVAFQTEYTIEHDKVTLQQNKVRLTKRSCDCGCESSFTISFTFFPTFWVKASPNEIFLLYSRYGRDSSVLGFVIARINVSEIKRGQPKFVFTSL